MAKISLIELAKIFLKISLYGADRLCLNEGNLRLEIQDKNIKSDEK
jgi:hypothetical protein